MSFMRITAYVASLAAAGAVGYWAGQLQVAETVTQKDESGGAPANVGRSSAPTAAVDGTSTTTFPQISEAAPDNDEEEPAAPHPHRQQIERLRTLADLQTEKLGTVYLSLIDRDGTLAEGFRRLFGLSNAESIQLQRAVDEANAAIQRITASKAELTRADETMVVVTVLPFEEAVDVYDDVEQAFAQTLGPERYAPFQTLELNQLSAAFSNFGAEQRTVQITRLPPDENGNTTFRLGDTHRGPPGSGSRSFNLQFADPTQLPESYRWLAPYLEHVNALQKPD